MICISIANAKGGVGKSTIAANLAYELNRMGASVLMIDLDSQCDLTSLYLEDDPRRMDILTVLQMKCRAENAVVEVKGNLTIIPGSPNINDFNFSGSEQALMKRLKAFSYIDFVLIDHPPSMHAASVAGFVASDAIAIVSDTEPFSIQNLGRLLDDLQVIQQTYNSNLNILGIILNKVDMRRKLTKMSIEKCEASFGEYLFSTYISYDTAVPNAHWRGIPLRKLPWGSRAVKQIREITEEILERMGIEIEH